MRKISVMQAVNEISSGDYMREVSNLAGIVFPILNLLSEKRIIFVKLRAHC